MLPLVSTVRQFLEAQCLFCSQGCTGEMMAGSTLVVATMEVIYLIRKKKITRLL